MKPSVGRPDQTSAVNQQQERDEQFRLLVEQVQDYAIFLIDPTGHVATWNAGAEHIKGYTAAEIIGQPYATFFTDEDRAAGRPERLMRRAREHGRVEDEGWRVRKDGSQFWADAVLTALYGADGHLRGYAKVTRDLTERRQLEEQRSLIQALQETAEARDQALAEVEAERALLHTVVRQMPAGVIVAKAPTGKLILGNEQVDQIWRQPFFASESVAEYTQYPAFHPDGSPSPPEERPLARALLASETVRDEEIEILRGDGSRGIILASAAPVLDRHGRIVAAVSTFTDITERKQIEREREQLLTREQAARTEAEAARERLQQFLGLVAHDLRNPLASILVAAQLLGRRGTSSERRERAAATIAHQARRMDRLIESLVDATRIGAGELKIQLAAMDLVALARQIVEAQQVTAPQHAMLLEAPERMEGTWDAARLEQVLDNLINNAIKYSPKGGEIRVRIEPQEDQVLLSVRDQGLGLRPEELPRLFQLFSRLESAGTIEGSGLGLYIVRGIVEAHGGHIWAESPGPEQGSTFYLALPCR
jgi:PAS domain S-box-containing protein